MDGVGDFTGSPLVARVNWPGKGCSSASDDARTWHTTPEINSRGLMEFPHYQPEEEDEHTLLNKESFSQLKLIFHGRGNFIILYRFLLYQIAKYRNRGEKLLSLKQVDFYNFRISFLGHD